MSNDCNQTPTNPEVYPVTARLEEQLREVVRGTHSDPEDIYDVREIVSKASEYLGEYEHGSVDVLDLDPLVYQLLSSTDDSTLQERGLKVMSAVLVDFIGTLFANKK